MQNATVFDWLCFMIVYITPRVLNHILSCTLQNGLFNHIEGLWLMNKLRKNQLSQFGSSLFWLGVSTSYTPKLFQLIHLSRPPLFLRPSFRSAHALSVFWSGFPLQTSFSSFATSYSCLCFCESNEQLRSLSFVLTPNPLQRYFFHKGVIWSSHEAGEISSFSVSARFKEYW